MLSSHWQWKALVDGMGQLGQEETQACHHSWGRLGILLQRGNAAILGNRVPSYPSYAIIGEYSKNWLAC